MANNETKYNTTTGNRFSVPSNYKGINTPFFSGNDYTKRAKCEETNARQFLAKGIVFKKERSILEFVGQKVTLEIKAIKSLLVPIEEERPDGKKEQTEEERAFIVLGFPKGYKSYYFALNSIMLDTLVKNGLLPIPEKTNEKDPVQEFPYTEKQIFSTVGKKIEGYFYYTMENGGGKKLFATPEQCESYHNAIQARFESSFESPQDQTPQEQEKQN